MLTGTLKATASCGWWQVPRSENTECSGLKLPILPIDGASSIYRFCISHERPLLPADWYDSCVALGEFRRDSAFHVNQFDPFWDQARPIAYGAAGSHVIPIAIARYAGEAEFIEISSYRKRILPLPLGVESQSYPTMRELRVGASEGMSELAVHVPKDEFGFLVAQPIYFKKSVLDHYTRIHVRTDILDYAAIAIELGVLDNVSAAEFLAAKKFFPGGVELGIYPKNWLVDALSRVEMVSREFLCRFGSRVKAYDKYQVRAVGFLSERLGSFLLLRELHERFPNGVPSEVLGHMTTIVTGDSGYSVGTANRSTRWAKLLRSKGNRGQ